MKKLFLTIALSLFVVGAFAQKKVLKNAEKAFRKENIEEAIQFAEEAAAHPETGAEADVYLLLGEIYLQKFINGGKESLEDAQKSFDWYNKAIEVDEKVEEDVMEAAMLSPQDANSTIGGEALGKLEVFLIEESNKALEAEDFEKSYTFLKLATEIRSDVTKDFFVAYSAENAGNDEVALEYYKKVMSSEEEYENKNYAYNFVIQNQLVEENYDAALANIRTAKELFPEEDIYRKWEVDVLIQTEKMDEAIVGLEALVDAGQAEKSTYYMLSYLQWNNDDYENALTNAKKALDLDPQYGDALYVAGSVYFNQGADLLKEANNELDDDAKYELLKQNALSKFKESLPFFERALEVTPNDPFVLRPLSTIYDQLGMADKRDNILDRLDALQGGN